MDDIVLAIDGKEARGKKGDTILDVCRKNGVYVPTLCHCEALPNVGSCRMCIVEIKGIRGVNTACTTPAMDGMVVNTDTEALNALRKDTLQLLFAERNHFCMFCESSGDCELQALAYHFKIDHFIYPFIYPKLRVDSSNRYFALDHNRCILCTRCVRACSVLAGIDTLGVTQRSAGSLICADLNVPIGESTCTSCGACVQVCPTGAMFEKSIAYRRRPNERNVTKSVCGGCGVGCGVDVVSRSNVVMTVEGDYESDVNKGLLCVKGRFRSSELSPDRITVPLYRRDGKLEEASWDYVLGVLAEQLRSAKDNAGRAAIAGAASAKLTNEDLHVFSRVMKEVVGSDSLSALGVGVSEAQAKATNTALGRNGCVEASLSDIAGADCIVAVGLDFTDGHGVVDSFIRRAAKSQGAKLIVIERAPSGLSDMADVLLQPKEKSFGVVLNGLAAIVAQGGSGQKSGKLIDSLKGYDAKTVAGKAQIDAADLKRAASLIGFSRNMLLVYGSDAILDAGAGIAVTAGQLSALGNGKIIAVKEKANSRGAVALGYKGDNVVRSAPEVALFLAGDEQVQDIPRWVEDAKFVAVQAASPSALTDKANIVFPAPLWTELSGSYVSSEGRIRKFSGAIALPSGVRPAWSYLGDLAERMGVPGLKYKNLESIGLDMARAIPGFGGEWIGAASGSVSSFADVACVDYLQTERR